MQLSLLHLRFTDALAMCVFSNAWPAIHLVWIAVCEVCLS